MQEAKCLMSCLYISLFSWFFALPKSNRQMLLAFEGVPTGSTDALMENHMACVTSEHQSEMQKGTYSQRHMEVQEAKVSRTVPTSYESTSAPPIVQQTSI